jgi:multidrug efflux pump subunit AcrB/ABC-type multidrug transport system ATPase subunit
MSEPRMRLDLAALSRAAIGRPVAACMTFLALALLGVLTWRQLPVQLLPSFQSPQLWVFVLMPGASPDTIERDVLRRLEGEISTVPGIEELTSRASTGQAIVTVSLRRGQSLDLATLRIQQRLAAIKASLSDQVQMGVQRFDTDSFANFVMSLSLRGDADLETLRHMAEEQVVPALQAVPGVVQVATQGGSSLQVAVVVDPERARAADTSVLAVRQALLSASRPVQAVGDVEEGGRRLPVVVDGRATRLDDIARAPVAGLTRVQDVAEVQLGIASTVEKVRIDGHNAVQVEVRKDPGANMLSVARRLRSAIDEWNAAQPGDGVRLAVDFDASEPIRENLDTLRRRAGTGAILALLVLMVFLRDLRSVAVVGLAIPATLLIAMVLFGAFHVTLNVLSLLGLAVSVGLLLDNAIVVLESIAARREKGDSPQEAARRGVSLVHRAIVAGTATTLVVFVPLFVVDAPMAPLFRELALSVTLPLMASLVVAIGLVPVVASRLKTRGEARGGVRWPVPFGAPRPPLARTIYSVMLRAALRSPAVTCVGMLLLVLIALVFLVPLVAVFTEPPRPPQESIEVVVKLPAGAGIDAAEAVAQQVESLARAMPQVEEVRTHVDEEQVRVTTSFLEEKKRTGPVHVAAERVKLEAHVRQMKAPPDLGGELDIQVDPAPDQDEAGPVASLAGGSQETLRVKGPAGQELLDLAAQVKDAIAAQPGIDAVRSDVGTPRPTLEIVPDRQQLAVLGLSPATLVGLLWTTRREGERLPYPVRLFGEDVPLALHVAGGAERTIDDVRRFPLGVRAGQRIPLSSVASVRTGSEPPLARRHERQRTVTITHGFKPEVRRSGESVENLRRAVDRIVAAIPLPAGTAIEVEHADDAGLDTLKQMLLLGFALVFVVLSMTFESATLPFLVVLAVPLAAVGTLASLVITGTGLNEMVVLALVVLLGLVVNQGILYIDRVEELLGRGYRRAEAVHRAAHDRLRPILMTTTATAVGLLPLAVSDDEGQLWPPFAIALLGGLLTSTLISLVFLPAAALLFGRLRDTLRTLGPALVSLATLACAALLLCVYFPLQLVASLPLRILLAVPAWLLSVLATRVIQALVRGERPPDVVGTGPVEVSVRNATKIYGGDPRPLRELRRIDRWDAIARRHGLAPRDAAPRPELLRQLTWQAGALGLLAYLLLHAHSTWGLALLSIPLLFTLGALVRTTCSLVGRPQAWPPRGWAGRLTPLLVGGLTWCALFWRHRQDEPWDVVVLVLAGIVLAAWAILHLVRAGGLRAILAGRLAPPAKTALDGVSLEFGAGLHGLLGPNGAGKSTLIRLAVNLFEPSRGTVEVNGFEVKAHAGSIQPRVGFLPQFFGVPPRLTARQYLQHQGLLLGLVDHVERARRIEEVLHEVGLADRGDEPMGGFSGGMRQRVGIARTLLNAPRIVVVDEPTVGLDPRERIRFRNLLADLARTRVVLLSTHVVEDIGSACEDVVVLDEGRVLFRGRPAELADRARGRAWTMTVPADGLAAFQRQHRIVSTTSRGDAGEARGIGEPPEGASPVEPSLEDAYLLLLGRHARDPHVA